MRTHAVEIGALQLDLAVTFGVAREISEKVADPMLIAAEAAMAARMEAAGIQYKAGRFAFDVENIPLILWLGAKPNHPDLKLSDVQEAICDAGFMTGMLLADGFLAQFIAPSAKEKIETKGKTKPGE